MLVAWTAAGQLLPLKCHPFRDSPSVTPTRPCALSKYRTDVSRHSGCVVARVRDADDLVVGGTTAASPPLWFPPGRTGKSCAELVYPDDVAGGPPPCLKCGDPTFLQHVRKFTINHGRPMWRCKSCDAHSWADCPLCYCGDGAVSKRRVAGKGTANEGRFFFCCATDDQKQQCRMFAWEDHLPSVAERKARHMSITPPDSVGRIAGALRPEMLNALDQDLLAGLRFSASHGGKVLLAGDMEQGQKILLALSAALQYESKWPLLVISPAQLRSTWSEEAHRWLGPTTSVFPVSSEADVKNAECLSSSWVIVTSYALLPCFSEAWLTKDRVIIVDESQQLRYEHTERFHTARDLLNNDHVVLVYGYPSAKAEEQWPELPSWTRPGRDLNG